MTISSTCLEESYQDCTVTPKATKHYYEEGFDLRAETVIHDQNTAYDAMLKKCPFAHNKDGLSYTIFKHADVMRVITDDATFSAQTSQYGFVPHGLDDPKHTLYRQAIAEVFTDEKMLPLLPQYREIAANLVDEMQLNNDVIIDAQSFAFYYTARVQLALLNWDNNLDKTCITWTKANLKATVEDNKTQNIENAQAWNTLVYQQLNQRRDSIASGLRQDLPNDVTDDLINISIHGQPMTDEEIASLIRNLNMGLVSSLACNIGNCIHFFAKNQAIQEQTRANMALLPEALEEITRLHGCLVQSKRVAKHPVDIRGEHIEAGAHVHVNWCSANRDGDIFEEPDCFKWGRDHSKHMMYGAGKHVCMGIVLARTLLQITLEALFNKTSNFTLDPLLQPSKIVFPANGYMTLPIHMHWQS